MFQVRHSLATGAALASAGVIAVGAIVAAQAPAGSNDSPNPYRTVEHSLTLPAGRSFGAISAVDVDKDGKSLWVAERCGANSGCLANPTVDPVLLFDASGKLVRSFGAGQLISPHGIHVDRDGNVWVTDYSDNVPRAPRGAAGAAAGRGRGAAAADGAAGTTAGAGATAAAGAAAGAAGRGAADGARGRGARGAAPAAAADGTAAQAPARGRGAAGPIGAAAGATIGHQVIKYSPTGTVLMKLGTAGGARDPEYFYQPNDVLVAPNGNIFVAEGHGGTGRVLIFDRAGKFLKQFGKAGPGPGEFNVPHALAMDSRGRLFIGDRANNRIQIFDQDGKFLEEWKQFGRPSGLFIDKNDVLYVADSESGDNRNPNYTRGIRVGSAKDGKVTALIPDPMQNPPSTSSAEGITADAAGNIYGGEVTEQGVKKYVKK